MGARYSGRFGEAAGRLAALIPAVEIAVRDHAGNEEATGALALTPRCTG